ncbi:ROK family protein [Fodinicola acaciae]|uniref:ROK family protein n=1 Tax=Fodinicola acaciae TaxID=2681555 RepID=UPI001C9E9D36|nr:ROK family protein [Fodinicola acaciae]
MTVVPVLEIGGTHVTAALVDARQIVARDKRPLAADGEADEILDTIAACANAVEAPIDAVWGVALPGPFDYADGIARYTGVGKFDRLDGWDFRTELRKRIVPSPQWIEFGNDAVAFGRGEWLAGAAHGHRRVVGLTLGTGVGSAFLADGVAVHSGPTVPPDGYAYRLTARGRPIEDFVSRRAIMAAYAQNVDVDVIAGRARDGEQAARDVLESAFGLLSDTLAPWFSRFGAEIAVVGGAMTGSWDVIGPLLAFGVPSVAANNPDAALLGAAAWAAR